jgi:hypothetical protein
MKKKLENPEFKSGNNSKELLPSEFDDLTLSTCNQKTGLPHEHSRIVKKQKLFFLISVLAILLFPNGCSVLCDVAEILLETPPPPPTRYVIIDHPQQFRPHNPAPQYRSFSPSSQARFYNHPPQMRSTNGAPQPRPYNYASGMYQKKK